VANRDLPVMQDCIWPRAILCISSANKIKELAGFNFNRFHNPDIISPEIISPEIISKASSESEQGYFDITHSQMRTGSPALVARQVQKKLGPRARIGLSVNAPLAQYAASQSLAGTPYVIAPWKINSELGDLELQSLLFIQKNLLQRLQLHGLKIVNQFTGLSRHTITRRFGLPGLKLLDLLNGQDFFANKSVAEIASSCITEYLVLPPNTSGLKLILRYLKQLSFRLARSVSLQNKHGKCLQLCIFYRNKKITIDCSLDTETAVSGKYIFNQLVEILPKKNCTKITLALEIKLIDAGHISGQEELLLECFA